MFSHLNQEKKSRKVFSGRATEEVAFLSIFAFSINDQIFCHFIVMGKLHTSQFYVLFLLTQKVEETFLCQENWSLKVERQTFPQMFLDFRFF